MISLPIQGSYSASLSLQLGFLAVQVSSDTIANGSVACDRDPMLERKDLSSTGNECLLRCGVVVCTTTMNIGKLATTH
jgi:hypothetical protein